MRAAVPFALALSIAACSPPPPAPPPPPEIAVGTASVAMDKVPQASLDAAVGRYSAGTRTVTVTRMGTMLMAALDGAAPVALTLVGLDTFAGPSGTAFLFSRNRLTLVMPDGGRQTLARTAP